MNSFNQGDFFAATSDIENYLGILKGNELVQTWWKDWQNDLDVQNAPRYGGFGYQSQPSPFELSVTFLYYGMPFEGDTPEYRQVFVEAEKVWQAGVSWAAGIGGYLRDICAPFTRANWDTLHDTWNQFDATRLEVLGAVPANWQQFSVEGWFGGSQQAYELFMSNLTGSMQEKLMFLSYAQAFYGRTADLVVELQSRLMEFVTTIRDGLREQCDQWAITSGTPMSIGKVNPKVIESLEVANDLAGYLPVVGEVKEKVEGVAESANKAAALFGISFKISAPEPFTLESADKIYTQLTASLEDNFTGRWDEGLDKLADVSRQVVAKITEAGPLWMPPTIENPRRPEWLNDFESPYTT